MQDSVVSAGRVAEAGGIAVWSAEQRSAQPDASRGLALAAPAVLWTIAFFLSSSGTIARWSLFRREGPERLTEPSLDNCRRFFENDSFRLSLWHSLEITLLVTALSVLLAYPLAWVIANRIAPARQRLWLMLAVRPFWTSYAVRSYAWLLVLAPEGVVSRALLALGMIEEPLALSFSLGATEVQVFTRVTVPLLWPANLGAFLLSLTFSWDEFIVAFLLSGFDPTLPVVIWSMLRTGLNPATNAAGTQVFVASLAAGIVFEWSLVRRRAG